MNLYQVGNVVRCTGAFTSAAGAAVDPTTVTFRARKPDGTLITYVYGTNAELVRDSTGNYRVDVSADAAGRWAYRFEGTGSAPSAAERLFRVEASRVQ
jgi:uncharacterized protein YfaS (alpha-2-macroglobulin family)